MIKESKNLLLIFALGLSLAACSSNDDESGGGADDTNAGTTVSFLGDSVTVANTFEDATLTGGAQTIYGLSDPTPISDPEVELPNYINFYDIDVSENTITMTLVNNSDAADLVLPEGRFDRYYVGFASNTVNTATLASTVGLSEFASVTILPAGFSLEAQDLFGTGIPVPVDFGQGGLLIELGAGTDLTNTGLELTVNID